MRALSFLFPILCLSTVGMTTACRSTTQSSAVTTESGAAEPVVADPLGAYSGDLKRWLRQVTAEPIEGHEIPVGSSARFLYDSIVVAPEGTWRAEATMHLAGEQFSCIESGSWSQVEALSRDEGRITLSLENTDCLSRSVGNGERLQIRYGSGSAVILSL